MPHWRTLIPGKYLTKRHKVFGDGEKDCAVTIKDISQAAFDRRGEADYKALLSFTDQTIPPFGANVTCCNQIEKMYGGNFQDWIGKQITLYVNPDVEYGGETVGGIRVRVIVNGKTIAGEEQKGPSQAEVDASRAELEALKAQLAAVKAKGKKGRK